MAQFLKVDNLLQIASLLSPIAALAVNVVCQIYAVRLRQGRNFLRCVAEGFLGGVFALVAYEYFLQQWRGVSGGAVDHSFYFNTLVYLLLAYSFFHFANLGNSSIRIRIYLEIKKSHGGISLREICEAYNESELMVLRLQRLVESGDVVVKNNRYYLGKARLAVVASVILMLKIFIIGHKTEFDLKRHCP